MGLTPQSSTVVASAATGILDPRSGKPASARDGMRAETVRPRSFTMNVSGK